MFETDRKDRALRAFRTLMVFVAACLLTAACQKQKEHIAPAIHERDSVPMMTSYGVNALISDSGVIKYRIVTEQWDLNPNVDPSRSSFVKGIFLTQFDEKFHVQAYIQCDTAYNYDKKKLWELRGLILIHLQLYYLLDSPSLAKASRTFLSALF